MSCAVRSYRASLCSWLARVQRMVDDDHPTTRWCGLSLLAATIQSANHSTLKAQHSTWAAAALRALKASPTGVIAVAGREAMRDLLVRSLLWPDTRRDVVVTHLGKFMPLLLQGVSQPDETVRTSLPLCSLPTPRAGDEG